MAASCLIDGGVVAHATEAVYGLAARALDWEACVRIAALKNRAANKPFIVIAGDILQLESLVCLEVPFKSSILSGWPGAHTWVLPADQDAPDWLRDVKGQIAVRVTAHNQAAKLCELAGPLISTSANLAGRPPARTVFAARRHFGQSIDGYLPGRTGGELRPTKIRHGVSGAVIRA